jgi:hypothetical protein
MFNIFKRNKETETYTIQKLHDGRFGIVKRDSNGNALLMNDYARKRDAVRGATRRGITLTV